MFQSIQPAPPDPILGLAEAFRADSRPDKINLTVGVYKDDTGITPALQCVAEARRQLQQQAAADQGYLGIDGLPAYQQHVRGLLLDDATAARAATAQTPGGTGALRIAGELLRRMSPTGKIWCSTPTWGNHLQVFSAAGLDVDSYLYADAQQRGLDFDAMMQSFDQMSSGDAVCLHACCHNPTGIDPSAEQWLQIAEALQRRSLLPLIDIAYQGLGDGLAEDAAGLQVVLQQCPEALICSSYSKNFSLYGERVGALTVVAEQAEQARAAMSHVKTCIRANYSNPPRHGAAIVAWILEDAALRGQWEQELAGMRQRILRMRQQFVEQMAAAAPDHDFAFIRDQRGMFSNSGLSPLQVDQLRSEHAIYIVGNGRINVAGMSDENLPRLCAALAQVL